MSYRSKMFARGAAAHGMTVAGLQAETAEADISPALGPVVVVTKATADSPYALGATVTTLLGNTVDGNLTVTLDASPTTGRIVNVKKIDAANTLTIDGNGKNIDGAATVAVTDNYTSIQLQYTGTEWSKI